MAIKIDDSEEFKILQDIQSKVGRIETNTALLAQKADATDKKLEAHITSTSRNWHTFLVWALTFLNTAFLAYLTYVVENLPKGH